MIAQNNLVLLSSRYCRLRCFEEQLAFIALIEMYENMVKDTI